MAITNDQLKISIEVESKDAAKNLASTTKQIDSLGKSLKKVDVETKSLATLGLTSEELNKTLRDLNMTEREFINLIQEAQAAIDSQNNAMQASGTSVAALATQTRNAAESAKKLSESNSAIARGVVSLSMGFQGAIISLNAFIQILKDLYAVFEMITDPEKLKRARQIIKTLAWIAKLKGNPQIASMLFTMADGLEEVSIASEEVKQKYERMLSVVQSGRDAWDSIKEGIDAVVPALQGLGVAYLSYVFLQARSLRTIVAHSKEFSDAYSVMTVNAKEAFTTISQVTSPKKLSSPEKIMKPFQGSIRNLAVSAEVAKVRLAGLFEELPAIAKESAVKMASTFKALPQTIASSLSSAFASISNIKSLGDLTKVFADSSAIKSFKSSLTITSPVMLDLTKNAKAMGGAFVDLSKTTLKVGGVITKDFVASHKVAIASLGKVSDASYATGKSVVDGIAKTIQAKGVHGFINLVEAANLAGVALAGLGTILVATDTKMGKAIGVVALFAAALAAGIGAVVGVILHKLGSALDSVGDRLINWMTELNTKAAKAELSFALFSSTLVGFQQTMGMAVGTADEWGATLGKLSDETLISSANLQKMAAELIAVGNSLGINKDQQMQLLNILPNFIKSDEEAFDTTVAFAQALGGSTQGLIKYGFHLNEAALSHTELGKTLQGSVDSLSDTEKAQLRFSAILEQSQPFMGRSAALLDTIAGSQGRLDKALSEVTVKLGEQARATVLYNVGITKFLGYLASMPDAVFSVVGSLTDVAAVMAKVIGLFLKFAIPLATVVTLYKALVFALNTFVVVQSVVNASFIFLGKILTVHVVEVNSAAAAWVNFKIVLRAFIVDGLVALRTLLISVTVQIGRMLIMMAPLLLKIAIFTTVVIALVEGLKRFDAQTKTTARSLAAYQQLFGSVTEKTKETAGALDSARKALKSLWDFIVNVFVVGINAFVLVLNSALLAIFAVVKQVVRFSDALSATMTDAINETTSEMKLLIANLAVTLSDLSGAETAFANTAESVNKYSDAMAQAAKVTQMLGANITGLSTQLDVSKILGTEAEVLIIEKQLLAVKRLSAERITDEKKRRDALKEIDKDIQVNSANLIKFVRESSIQSMKAIEEAQGSIKPEFVNVAEIKSATKTALDAVSREITARREELSVLDVRGVGAALGNLQREYNTRVNAISVNASRQIETLTKQASDSLRQLQRDLATDDILAPITLAYEERVAKIEETRKALERAGMLEQNLGALAKLSANAEALRTKEIEKSLQSYQALTDQVVSFGMDEVSAIEFGLEKRYEEIDAIENKLALLGKLGVVEQANLDLAREQAAIKAGKAIDVANAKQNAEDIKPVQDAADLFTKGAAGAMDMVAQVLSALGPVGAMVGGILKMLSLAPEQFKELLTGLLQGLMEIPGNILKNISQIIPIIVGLLPKLMTSIVDVLGPSLLSTLIEVVFQIVDLITNTDFWIGLVDSFINALADSITTLVNKLPALFEIIIGRLIPMLALQLPTLILNIALTLIGRLVPVAIQAVAQILQMLISPDFWGQVVMGFANAIMGALDNITELFGVDLGDFGTNFAASLTDAIGSGMEEVTSSVTDVSESMFKVLDEQVALKGIDQAKKMGNAIQGATSKAVSWLKQAWGAFTQAIKDAFLWVWDSVLVPLGGLVKAAWESVINFFMGFGKLIIAAFEDVFKMLANIGTEIWGVFEKIWTKILSPFGTEIWGVFEKIWTKVLSPFGTAIWGVFEKIWTKILSPFSTGLLGVFDKVGGILMTGVKALGGTVAEIFGGVGKIVTNSLSGIGSFLVTNVTKAFSGATNLLSSLFKVDYKGKGTVENFLGIDFPWANFAQGGFVGGKSKTGGDSERNDTIPALLSPGEFVIPRSLSQDKNFMDKFFELASGKEVQRYGFGGWIKEQAGNVGGALKKGADYVGGKLKSGYNDFTGAISGVSMAVLSSFAGLPQDLLEIWNFIRSLGASLDMANFVMNPVKEATRAFKTVASKYLGPVMKAGLGFADGGLVPGYGNGDTVPSMLTPGEFVIRKPAVQEIGLGRLNNLNSGSGSGANTTQNFNITMNIKTEQPIDGSMIRTKIMPELEKQLRRLSLDGKRVLNPSGVR